MGLYPFYNALQDESKVLLNGNFGLWYNKFIPLSNKFKASDDRGNDTRAAEFYFERYGQMKKGNVAELLKQKHNDQRAYCGYFPSENYESIQIEAILESPLLTGIGESHPNEVSMVFDHNLGIPYIPASGVKGIVRFAHTVSLIPEAIQRDPEIEKSGKFDDEDEWTFVLNMFGGQKKKGEVVFLDAYPKDVPQLHIDIMNPHYGLYYSDGVPPADHHNPTPIKFLTVAPGTTFIFRAVTKKENGLPQKVKKALLSALTEEGVGAKTAVGYGRFAVDEKTQSVAAEKGTIKEKAEPTPLEKCCAAFTNVKPGDAGRIGSLIDTALKTLISEEDKKAFAKYVKEFMGKDFKKSKAKDKIKNYLV